MIYRYMHAALVGTAMVVGLAACRHVTDAAYERVSPGPALVVARTEVVMPEMLQIDENTQVQVSGHLVGAGNIWKRDFDEDGAKTSRMSASLGILDQATHAERREMVRVGSLLVLGADRYRVTAVDAGDGEHGFVSLEKVLP